MADTKMLRGKAALTIVRGNPGRHVYRNEIVDPRQLWDEDRERLTTEGFLEWVVPDGDGWKLAEDTDSGAKGDSVTVGSTSADVSRSAQQSEGNDPADPGLVNQQQIAAAPVQGNGLDADRDRSRTAAKAKLPTDGTAPHANAGKDVWVEYAVAKGMDRGEAEKADKADLIAALKA